MTWDKTNSTAKCHSKSVKLPIIMFCLFYKKSNVIVGMCMNYISTSLSISFFYSLQVLFVVMAFCFNLSACLSVCTVNMSISNILLIRSHRTDALHTIVLCSYFFLSKMVKIHPNTHPNFVIQCAPLILYMSHEWLLLFYQQIHIHSLSVLFSLSPWRNLTKTHQSTNQRKYLYKNI